MNFEELPEFLQREVEEIRRADRLARLQAGLAGSVIVAIMAGAIVLGVRAWIDLAGVS